MIIKFKRTTLLSDINVDFLVKINDIGKIKKGIDYIIEVKNQIPAQYRTYTDAGFKKNLDKISKAKGKEIEDYITEVIK